MYHWKSDSDVTLNAINIVFLQTWEYLCLCFKKSVNEDSHRESNSVVILKKAVYFGYTNLLPWTLCQFGAGEPKVSLFLPICRNKAPFSFQDLLRPLVVSLRKSSPSFLNHLFHFRILGWILEPLVSTPWKMSWFFKLWRILNPKWLQSIFKANKRPLPFIQPGSDPKVYLGTLSLQLNC